MISKEVVINNQVGLHARPATFFIQKANEFKSSIWVEKEERRVNAKSLLGVLSLGIVKGTAITIIHGKGTGALRTAVQNMLRHNKFVKSFRLGRFGEGEAGVTIVELK